MLGGWVLSKAQGQEPGMTPSLWSNRLFPTSYVLNLSFMLLQEEAGTCMAGNLTQMEEAHPKGVLLCGPTGKAGVRGPRPRLFSTLQVNSKAPPSRNCIS